MKTKKPNAELVWKQMEDQVVPRLRLGTIEHLIYCHLLRHSLLEGKRQIRFSISWLGRNILVCHTATRMTVRRLIEQGVLRLVEYSRTGRLMEVRLPEEILADHPLKEVPPPSKPRHTRYGHTWPHPGADLEKQDFLRTVGLRHAIHAREAGRCFYCLRLLAPHMKCLDHVVPLAQSGSNSYRNLVSACRECNAQKGQCRADDFLRSLFRERKLTDRDLAARLRALDALAAGKLPPLPPAPTPARRSPASRDTEP